MKDATACSLTAGIRASQAWPDRHQYCGCQRGLARPAFRDGRPIAPGRRAGPRSACRAGEDAELTCPPLRQQEASRAA